MTYEQAKNKFLKIKPKFAGKDVFYDALVILFKKSEKDKTVSGDMRQFFINNFEKYLDETIQSSTKTTR